MPNLWTKRDGEKNWTTGPRNAFYDLEVETTPTRLREGRRMPRPSSNTATASNGPTSVQQSAFSAFAPTRSAVASTFSALVPVSAPTAYGSAFTTAATQATGAESEAEDGEEVRGPEPSSLTITQAPIFLDDADLILEDEAESAVDYMDLDVDDVKRELEVELERGEQVEIEPEHDSRPGSGEHQSLDFVHDGFIQMPANATTADSVPSYSTAPPEWQVEEDRVLHEQMKVLRERLGRDRANLDQQAGPAHPPSFSVDTGRQRARGLEAQPHTLQHHGRPNARLAWNGWPSTYPAAPPPPLRPSTYPSPNVQPAKILEYSTTQPEHPDEQHSNGPDSMRNANDLHA